MLERYKKNIGTCVSEDGQNILLTKTIGLIGVGGNGGYIAEYLARLGIKKLIIFDHDRFEESNLNRQTFCFENNLNSYKAESAIKKLKEINSSIEYEYYCVPFGTIKYNHKFEECDLIINAADGNQYTNDNYQALRQLLINNNIPILVQSVSNYGGRLGIITKENLQSFEEEFERWFRMSEIKVIPISQPAYLCAFMACLAVQEVVDYFTTDRALINQTLFYDFYEKQLHRKVNNQFVY